VRSDAAHNRQRILAATIDAVAADGVSVPTAEIAERARVGVSTVYRHFPDRRVLLASCSVWGWERIDGLIRTAEGRPPSLHDLLAVLGDVATIMVDGAPYLEATGERVGRTPVEILPVRAVALERFAGLVDRASHAGAVRPGTHPTELLELTMELREADRVAPRLELLARAAEPVVVTTAH
jgi:AcrR family transcriptional regulator